MSMFYEEPPPPPAPSGEAPLYQDPEVVVTRTRFAVGATMYPVRNLTAVSADERHERREVLPNRLPAKICAVSALVAWVAGSIAYPDGGGLNYVVPASLMVLAVTLGLRAKGKVWTESYFAVTVHTAGAQREAFVTTDKERRDAVLMALHRAVAGE